MIQAEISKGKRKIMVQEDPNGGTRPWLYILEEPNYHRKIARFASYIEAYDLMEYLAGMLKAEKIQKK